MAPSSPAATAVPGQADAGVSGHRWLGSAVDDPSKDVSALAHRLIALEASLAEEGTANEQLALRVCEKLRTAVTQFAGPEGFGALMRRAIALARTDVPGAAAITATADGAIAGWAEHDPATSGQSDAEARTAIVAAIITRLLQLLGAFVGEAVTLRLARNAWPVGSLKD